MAGIKWQNRIVGYDQRSPRELAPHPLNWRVHLPHQQRVVTKLLDRLGWVAPVIVNQRTGRVVDGHLRLALALQNNEPSIPVVLVDLSEEEERVALASLDPSAALAEANEAILEELVRSISDFDDLARALHLPTGELIQSLKGFIPDSELTYDVVVAHLTAAEAENVRALLQRHGYEAKVKKR